MDRNAADLPPAGGLQLLADLARRRVAWRAVAQPESVTQAAPPDPQRAAVAVVDDRAVPADPPQLAQIIDALAPVADQVQESHADRRVHAAVDDGITAISVQM